MSDNALRWPISRRVERRARRMEQMIDRLDVDRVKLVRLRRGETYAEIMRTCFQCQKNEQCRDWLSGNRSVSEAEFCPNLPVLLACRRPRDAGAGTQ